MKACVIGLGKVGLPLAAQIATRGNHMIGCDASSSLVEQVNRGECPLPGERGLEEILRQGVQSGLLEATTDTSEGVRRSEVVVIIVPAKLTADNNADLRLIDAAASDIAAGLQPGTLVILETTVPVGTTRNHLGPLLEKGSGLNAGTDFHLVFSPERVGSGTVLEHLKVLPKVVGGTEEEAGRLAADFYSQALGAQIIRVSSAETAELSKLAELTYRDVNIALANELALCAERAAVDVLQAIAAANSQPFSHIHEPGVGVGGHCVPVNPWFLINGLGPAPIARLARETNDSMAREAARLLDDALGGLSGRTVLILGLAYRGNVKEPYHSATFLLNEALTAVGTRVLVHDPLFSPEEIAGHGLKPASLEPPPQVDAIILQANHDEYRSMDFGVFSGCRVLLDGRNVLSREEVEAKGLLYLGIGRQLPAEGPPTAPARLRERS